ncbi:MAG TPA: hypothetical protein VFQ80_07350, partial [Thermomicrobiales bacterium]|nr:hypothetical protein [Thermomicrobiales bacterium]
LRLAARHADVWNAVGVPDDVRTVNRRMDEACRVEGRDPASLVRSVSTRLDLLASVPAFAEGVAAYRDAGFNDLYVPWPRTAKELDVLRQVARDVLPGLRRAGRPADSSPAAADRLRALDDGDLEATARVCANIDDPAARRLLEFLIAHPDTRFDGAALIEPLGFDRHVEVTLAAASLAAAFAKSGVASPWNESQLGYLLPAASAALLARAHEAAGCAADGGSR